MRIPKNGNYFLIYFLWFFSFYFFILWKIWSLVKHLFLFIVLWHCFMTLICWNNTVEGKLLKYYIILIRKLYSMKLIIWKIRKSKLPSFMNICVAMVMFFFMIFHSLLTCLNATLLTINPITLYSKIWVISLPQNNVLSKEKF